MSLRGFVGHTKGSLLINAVIHSVCDRNHAVTMSGVLWVLHLQMKQIEDRLRNCDTQRELAALRRKLDLVEEERRDYNDKYSKAELEVKDLRYTGEST